MVCGAYMPLSNFLISATKSAPKQQATLMGDVCGGAGTGLLVLSTGGFDCSVEACHTEARKGRNEAAARTYSIELCH